MRMSILLYDGFTTLDIVGGYESLARIPNMQTEFVAKEVGIYAADTRALGLYAWKTFEDAKGTDIRPGGWAFTPRNATRKSSTSFASRMRRRPGP
jgi:hypothetical protein